MRVKRLMEERKSSRETAEREIARFDSGSREFIKRYFQAGWEDPIHYDLVLNTENLSFQAAASIIVHALSIKA
jgi:cytidylate kinase